jgi:hypothetical protein
MARALPFKALQPNDAFDANDTLVFVAGVAELSWACGATVGGRSNASTESFGNGDPSGSRFNLRLEIPLSVVAFRAA